MSALRFEQAVILAGGKGTRLLPLTLNIPKPMVQISGKPFLHWQLEYLKRQGIRKVLLLISHLGEQVITYFKHEKIPDLTIEYSEESSPLGTGGALRLAQNQLDSVFWLINGDSFLPMDLHSMENHFCRHDWFASVAALSDLSLVPVPGNLKIEDDLVVDYRKGAGPQAGFRWVDAGIYLMYSHVVFNGPNGVFELERYWPPLMQKNKFGAFQIQQRFYDIGTPERLKIFEESIHDYF